MTGPRIPAARRLPAGRHASPLRAGSLCTGYGGLDVAVAAVLGTALAWCAETDRHASNVLAARFPGVPNLGDLTGVGWAAVPPVDLVTAGFPCQDISTAGRGAGIEKGTRSGLWTHIAEALGQLRPGYVLVENVAALRARGLGRVLADLAALGYDTQWASLRASDIGAAHRRDRIFILGWQPAALPRLLTAAADAARLRHRDAWPPCLAGLPAAAVPGAAADSGGRELQRHRVPGIVAGPARPAEAAGP
jgi:DNA (cytosine-5)-methyltransferase 1